MDECRQYMQNQFDMTKQMLKNEVICLQKQHEAVVEELNQKNKQVDKLTERLKDNDLYVAEMQVYTRNYQAEVVNENRAITEIDKPLLHDTTIQSRLKYSNMAFN